MRYASIPRFSLYGEPEHVVAERFIHIETVAERSGCNDWTIRPHRHAMLDHLLVIEQGGGEMQVDGRTMPFGRAILVVPAGLVHGFRFTAGTMGHVITVADPLIVRLAAGHAPIQRLRERVRCLPLPVDTALGDILTALMAETAAPAPLAGLAGEALLQLVLIQACRLLPDEAGEAAPARRAAGLVARFGLQLDRHLRDGWSIADHAGALGTSVARLRAACVEVTGQPPVKLLHDRLLAEARRQLAYTDRTVAEVGFDLGFEDAAYFSRFFRRGEGVSPAGWRAAQAANVSVSISA